MEAFRARINIRLKPGILDPQGKAVEHALQTLGFETIQEVHSGKFFELKIQAKNKQEAEQIARKSCEKLLANPVIEHFTVEIEPNKRNGNP